MKSKYIKPQTLVINMGALQLLSGSGKGVSDDGKKVTLTDVFQPVGGCALRCLI